MRWRYMTRKDAAVIGGVVSGVAAITALVLVAVYGPAGALHQLTGGPAPDSSPTAPASAPVPRPNGPGGPDTRALYSHCGTSIGANPTDFRVLIPRLGVDAHTEALGIDSSTGQMATPSGKFCNVGWYSRGTAPGAPGDAVVDGHLDWNGAPAVFWKLGTLRQGDEVVVHREGAVLHFKVQSVGLVPYNATPPGLFSTVGSQRRLSLITCGGTWDPGKGTYDQRVVVDAIFSSRTA